MSDSVRPHRRQPTRLHRPWDSPGKNTGVGCHFLLQCMKVKSEGEVAQSCPTFSDPMDCSLPGSSVHGFSRQEYWSGVPSPSPKRLYYYSSIIIFFWVCNSKASDTVNNCLSSVHINFLGHSSKIKIWKTTFDDIPVLWHTYTIGIMTLWPIFIHQLYGQVNTQWLWFLKNHAVKCLPKKRLIIKEKYIFIIFEQTVRFLPTSNIWISISWK